MNRNCFWLSGILFLQACLGCATTHRAEQRQLADRQSLEAQLSLARLSERHGKLDFARQIYGRALESSPENVVAHHRLAVIDARQGRLDDADKHFKAAMKSGQPGVDLLSDYGYALYLKEDLKSAERVLREVVKREPRHTAARNNLALVLGEQGRFDECFQEFRMAVDEPEALANLAYVKSQMGEFQDAQKAYHRALALKGDMRPAAEALIQLSEIEGVIESSKSLIDPAPISPPNPPSIRPDQIAKAKPPANVPSSIENVGSRLPPLRPNKAEQATGSRREIQLAAHVSDDNQLNSTLPTRQPVASRAVESDYAAPTHNGWSPSNARPEQSNAAAVKRTDEQMPRVRTPSFFPGSVSPDPIDLPGSDGQSPTGSRIETIQSLAPPTFETSFVDDLHTEFSGGNAISSGQSFWDESRSR